MAAAAFSIRGFAASKRGELAAEGRRPLGIKALPPIEAPKFRWWADELASAVASAAAEPSTRRSTGKAKPPKKKRSISDLFAAAPPLAVPPSDDSGENEQTEVEDDEALCAIARRAKEEKKRKRRLHEEEEEQEDEEAAAAAAAAASAEGIGRRETEGNFEATKETPENSNLPDGLDRQPSQRPEASQNLREEMENMSRRKKGGKINFTKKKKAGTGKCIDNNKADKLGKPRDLEKHLPRQSILKIKRTSVKMVKEKHGNSKGKEVIELCRKSVKRVKFSEADDILGSEMQSCELPKRRSLSELFSDAMASSSSSSSSSSASSEGDKCITSESCFHMPMEAVIKTKANLDSNEEDSPTEGDKCRTAESSSSHMPKEAITETKEAILNPDHEDSPTEGDKCKTAESSSSHMPKEAITETKEAILNPDHEDSPTEGDKCKTAESSSSHMPKEAVTENKEANLNSNHEDSPTEGDKCRTAESISSHMPKEAFTMTNEVSLNLNHEDSSTEGHKCGPVESSSSHVPKEAFTKTEEVNLNSSHEGSPTEGDKCRTAEGSSSHMPKEAVTKTKEANLNSNLEDFPVPSNTELPSPLLDLNEALPESTDLNYTYNSNSEVPYLEHAHEESFNSDVQLLDERENQTNLYFDSHKLASQLPAADPESVWHARSAGTLLQAEQVKVSGVDIVDPALSLRELGETHRDCSNVSVKDTMTMSMSPCALPDHTFQDSFQQHQNGFHTNLNHGESQLSAGGKFPSWSSRELNVQRGCSPSVGQTLRLMGKDLAVCTTRGEMSAETIQKHTGTFTNDHQKTNTVLELPRQGKPFLSLQAQSFPNVTVNFTSTIHASTYHASTSQAHVGYRTPHDFTHRIPAANVFSGDRLPYESRFIDFSNSQPSQPFLLGCPPLPNNHSAALNQNSPLPNNHSAALNQNTPLPNNRSAALNQNTPLPNNRSAALNQTTLPWRYYSDPINRTELPTAQFWPTTRQHGTPSSVFRGSLPQQHIVHSASSSARPLNSVSSTFSHPARVVQEASTVRDAAFSSRNLENRMGRAVPGNSNPSSSGRYVQKRQGPVKLTPGAKHILVPSDSTGDSDSVPVYSCVSFGSRSGNAGASQNKGV